MFDELRSLYERVRPGGEPQRLRLTLVAIALIGAVGLMVVVVR